MKELIEALQIFQKYKDIDYPTHCEHDVMYINQEITKDDISPEDIKRLDELGFNWSDSDDMFISYKFGSC